MLLDAGAAADRQAADGSTPLHFACKADDPAIVARLLEDVKGQLSALLLTDRGLSCTLVCATHGHTACLELLLNAGVSPDHGSLRWNAADLYIYHGDPEWSNKEGGAHMYRAPSARALGEELREAAVATAAAVSPGSSVQSSCHSSPSTRLASATSFTSAATSATEDEDTPPASAVCEYTPMPRQ